MVACLPYLFGALEDRAAEVRKAAQEATLPFMIHLGYETMAKNAGKLKPVSKSLVLAHLDKVRPNLPARPTTAPAAAPSTAIRTKGAIIQNQKEPPKEEEDSGKANAGKSLRVPSKSKVSYLVTIHVLSSRYHLYVCNSNIFYQNVIDRCFRCLQCNTWI